jgi:hypothetical protein
MRNTQLRRHPNARFQWTIISVRCNASRRRTEVISISKPLLERVRPQTYLSGCDCKSARLCENSQNLSSPKNSTSLDAPGSTIGTSAMVRGHPNLMLKSVFTQPPADAAAEVRNGEWPTRAVIPDCEQFARIVGYHLVEGPPVNAITKQR